MRAHALILGIWFSGCAEVPTDHDVRQAWLIEAISDDNRVWLSRDGALLSAKYRRMAADPYNYMRGTGGVAFRDWSRPGTERVASSFIQSTEASSVLLVGDPHPENVGTYLPGDQIEPTSRALPIVLTLEITDFDTAGFGPWTLDVRRGAQGLRTVLVAAACDLDCADRVISAYAEGYADEIQIRATRDGGWPPARPATEGPGNALDRLVTEATEEGLARARLLAWTRHTIDGRRFHFDHGLDAEDRGLLPLDDGEARQLNRLLAAWEPQRAPRGFRVLDRARFFGLGVASIPATRYVALFDRGDPGMDDDGILMFREVIDPPVIPGVIEPTTMLWDSNGDRVVDAAQTLWSRPDADPWMAAAVDGDLTFKAVTGSSFNEGLAHEELIEDSIESVTPEEELADLADELGRLLASVHARGRTFAGGSAAEAIATDLGPRTSQFASEAVQTSRIDTDQVLLDYRLFRNALDELGPLLGAEAAL